MIYDLNSHCSSLHDGYDLIFLCIYLTAGRNVKKINTKKMHGTINIICLQRRTKLKIKEYNVRQITFSISIRAIRTDIAVVLIRLSILTATKHPRPGL